MALETNELLREGSKNPEKRIFPIHSVPKVIGPIAGAPELGVGFPLAYDTVNGYWVPWTNGGVNGTGDIRGIVHPRAIQTSAVDDVQGVVMVDGEVHHDDVLLPSGELQASLTAELQANVGDRNIHVTGIAKVR